jgi:hypothetical protein
MEAAGCTPAGGPRVWFVGMAAQQPDPPRDMHLEHTLRDQLRKQVEAKLGRYPPASDSPGQIIPRLNTKLLKQDDWEEAERRVRERHQDSPWLKNLDALLQRARYTRPGDQVFSSGSLGRNKDLIQKTYTRLFQLMEQYENEVMVEYWMMNPGANIPWDRLRRPGGSGGWQDLLPRSKPRDLPQP